MNAYTTVSLPRGLHRRLAGFIEQHPELGYGSVAEFAKEAIRLRIEEMQEEAQQISLGRLRQAHASDWQTRWKRYRDSARR